MEKKQFLGLVIVIVYILIIVIASLDVSNYFSNLPVSFEVNENKIVVNLEQLKKMKFINGRIECRIREYGMQYGKWEDSNIFENLDSDIYYVQIKIVLPMFKTIIFDESEVHMYNGDLVTINDIVLATESGGLYTVPYYVFAEKHTYSKTCDNSGKRAGVFGDTWLGNCYCGAKRVASRTGERVKYRTWDGYDAYRDVYVYDVHERIVTERKYNYTYNIEDGVGSLEHIYYAKEDNI